MASFVFEVKVASGHIQKGMAYTHEGCAKHLVLMTGMNEHATRYQDFGEYLNTKGYNVYVLDAISQGLNVSKVEDQEKWFVGAFDENVEAANVKVMELKKTGQPVALMGHSMGSFMVQRYLELYPNTADRYVIMGSNGPALAKMKMGYLVSKMLVNKKNWDLPNKTLSGMGVGAYGKAIKNRRTDLDWLSYNQDNVDKYMADPFCGHEDTGGFWREFLKGMSVLYTNKELKKISKTEDILIVSGAEDPVGECGKGPRRLQKMYQKLGLKDVELKIFDNMRHEIHNEKDHMIVYKTISDFLNA